LSDLHDRIARALNWSPADVRSFSMQSLRDLVHPVNPNLAREMDLVIRSGAYIANAPVQTKKLSPSSQASATKFKTIRRIDRETKTSEDHPGMSAPRQGTLSIGRKSEDWKPLYWKRVLAEYKKEASKRGDLSNTIKINLWVRHAPDEHTPFVHVDWPDPLDARGAEKFARELVEDGGARFTGVVARVRRPYSKEEAVYTLANFERAD
jgi:hypothetical protein